MKTFRVLLKKDGSVVSILHSEVDTIPFLCDIENTYAKVDLMFRLFRKKDIITFSTLKEWMDDVMTVGYNDNHYIFKDEKWHKFIEDIDNDSGCVYWDFIPIKK